MGNVSVRKETGRLYFDFRYQGKRCREQTLLDNTPDNVRKMQTMMKRIDAEITLGTFDYSRYFPTSSNVSHFQPKNEESGLQNTNEPDSSDDTPTVDDFSKEWFEENQIRWKRSYRYMIRSTLDGHLLPAFGQKKVSNITKGEVLKFRSTLAKVSNGNKEGLSPDRINHIMTPLRMILADAADRHNFTTPFIGIKPLKVPRTEVDPFSLDEVRQFLAKVRADFRDYYIVRFFTGMRTSEIDGLKWSNVDFERRQILIRETVVMGEEDTTKTDSSRRFIEMSKPVYEALLSHHKVTGAKEGFVFCTRTGEPMNYSNVTNRIWYPTLRLLGLKKRRPYQTRHTTATLWLASGENPE
ncbi:MAG: site-specific integrase, partial [Trichlorobacter sp.]|uniref:site-specific integrase n=1 Tax=Trichlorobacter sp. TaxID=2911007 RepID=UPI00256CF8AD